MEIFWVERPHFLRHSKKGNLYPVRFQQKETCSTKIQDLIFLLTQVSEINLREYALWYNNTKITSILWAWGAAQSMFRPNKTSAYIGTLAQKCFSVLIKTKLSKEILHNTKVYLSGIQGCSTVYLAQQVGITLIQDSTSGISGTCNLSRLLIHLLIPLKVWNLL